MFFYVNGLKVAMKDCLDWYAFGGSMVVALFYHFMRLRGFEPVLPP
jgi:hypothetical protein